MGYWEKHLENEKVAQSLYEQKYYDSSINRYYYSVFQLILYKLDQKSIKLEEDSINNKSSHEKAINSITEYLKMKNKNNIKNCFKIKSNFKNIKKFRKKSDYEEEKANEEEAKHVKNTYNELKNLLKVI